MQNTSNSGTRTPSKRKDIPDGIWVKCSECSEIIYNGELSRNLKICPRCNCYFPFEPAERVAFMADPGSFARYDAASSTARLDEETGDRAAVTGEIKLSGHSLVLAAANLNSNSEDVALYVCEKIVGAAVRAVDRRLPLLIICTSSTETLAENGAFFPAQTLSISAAIGRMAKEKLLYISVLGHSGSQSYFPGFAYIADVVIAESNIPPASLSGDQNSQNGAVQAAQCLFQNGMLDMMVSRRELNKALTNILSFFS